MQPGALPGDVDNSAPPPPKCPKSSLNGPALLLLHAKLPPLLQAQLGEHRVHENTFSSSTCERDELLRTSEGMGLGLT